MLFELPIRGVYFLKSGCIEETLRYSQDWTKLGTVYQIFDDISDYLGLKQKGQRQKDFIEKRMNAIVSYIAKDPNHSELIQRYLSVTANSVEQVEVIMEINKIVLKDEILNTLQSYADGLLTQFKEGQPSQGKALILSHLEKTLNQGKKKYAEFQI